MPQMREGHRNMLLFGTLILGLGAVGAIYSFGGGGSRSYDVTRTFASAEVASIAVESSSVDVNVKPGTGDQVLVHFHGTGEKSDDYQLSAETDDGQLKVRIDKEDNWQIGFNVVLDLDLDITVPQKQYDAITMDSSSGDISLWNLETRKAAFEASSGDINLTGLTADSVTIETSSGNVALDEVTGLNTISTSSGDIEGRSLTAKGTLKAESSSGGMTLREVSGGVDLSSSSGDIDLYIRELKEDLTLEASSGTLSLYLPRDAGYTFETKTNSGDVEFENGVQMERNTDDEMSGTYKGGGPKIKAETSSGDISFIAQ